MPAFEIINNVNDIVLGEEWVFASKFNCKDRLVDEDGESLGEDYSGHRYRIIEKRERIYTTAERIGRGFAGAVAVVGTIFLGLFFKSVRDLFVKPSENIRFALLVPEVNEQELQEQFALSETELQLGISISEEIIETIKSQMGNILQRQAKDGLKLYNSQDAHRVFELDIEPNIIFKMEGQEGGSIGERYQKMINAQTVVRANQLGLLVIPRAKLFSVEVENKKYDIIAEQKLDICTDERIQEDYFQKYADSLNETIRQLATFICKTGYSDVEWRNNPVLNNSLDIEGNRKIALIDIEDMNGATMGLFGVGYPAHRGLVGCVNEEQGKIVEEAAIQNGISTASFENAYNLRKTELLDDVNLSEYHAAKNINIGDELLEIVEDLDFSDRDDEAQEELKNLLQIFLSAFNEKISQSSLEDSVKLRRSIFIKTTRTHRTEQNVIFKKVMEDYDFCLFEDGLKKLRDLGVIYKFERTAFDFYIQA